MGCYLVRCTFTDGDFFAGLTPTDIAAHQPTDLFSEPLECAFALDAVEVLGPNPGPPHCPIPAADPTAAQPSPIADRRRKPTRADRKAVGKQGGTAVWCAATADIVVEAPSPDAVTVELALDALPSHVWLDDLADRTIGTEDLDGTRSPPIW